MNLPQIVPARTRRIVWKDPDSKWVLTYATFPLAATDEIKLRILERCRDEVRTRYDDNVAQTVQFGR